MIRALVPDATTPLNTLPNAKNRPLSALGTILLTYIIRGACNKERQVNEDKPKRTVWDIVMAAHSWVTIFDAQGTGIIMWAFVQQLHAIPLGSDRRREMDGDHLEEGIASWQPLLHDHFEQLLAFKFLYKMIMH